MKKSGFILFLLLHTITQNIAQGNLTKLDFFGEEISIPTPAKPPDFLLLSTQSVQQFVSGISEKEMQPYVEVLANYKQKNKPDDWFYYQLVRKVAQIISPKSENYNRYTLYKWWLMVHAGYDAQLTLSDKYLLFYIQSNDSIYNIPYHEKNGKQYVCLNYHDYGSIDFDKYHFDEIVLPVSNGLTSFSYKINQLPEFKAASYTDHKLSYEDRETQYQFHIKVNPEIKTLFANYPVVDYRLQFNIPLSKTTYQSLIPMLKEQVKSLNEKDGVDFLMRFTRYAFIPKSDSELYGGEKRMSPEQTLMYEYSDCEDRSALFYFLVKEIYNLPMLVLAYSNHVSVAVEFKKSFGKTIEYNGMKYSICDPSPHKNDLPIGQLLPELKKQSFEIAYAYLPH